MANLSSEGNATAEQFEAPQAETASSMRDHHQPIRKTYAAVAVGAIKSKTLDKSTASNDDDDDDDDDDDADRQLDHDNHSEAHISTVVPVEGQVATGSISLSSSNNNNNNNNNNSNNMNMNTINKVASGLGDANRPPIAPPSAPATPATATAGAKMKLEDEEQLQQPASISLQLDGVVAGKNGDNSSSTTSNMLLATNTACGMTDIKSDAAAAATTNNNNNINTGAGDADAGGKSGSRQQHQFTLERTQAIHDNDDSASQPRRQQLCDRQVKHERDASRQDLSLSQQQQQQQQRQANQATSKTPQAADNGTANGAGSFRGRGSGSNSDRASQPTRNDSSDPPSTRLNHLTTTCTANADQIGLANCSNSDCSAKNNGNVAPDNPVVGNVGSCNGQVGDSGNNISKQNSSNSGSSLISAQQQQPATATINQEVRYCKESSLKNPTSNTSNSSEAPENNKLNFKSSQTIEFETNNNNNNSTSSNRRTIPVSSVNSVLVDSKQQQKATSKLLLAPHNDNTGSNTINSTRAIISNSNNLNNNNNNYSNNTNYYRHQEDLPYYQKLFFTRWPIYAVAICTMASLLFAIFSSVLSVYLTCGLQPTSAAYSPASSLSSRTSSEALIDALDVASSSSSVTSLASNNFTRLPSSLWPIHYDLFFQPYIREPFDFDGKVSIRIKCTVATNNISLHTKDLELDRKSLKLTLVTQQQNDALNISKQHQQQQLPSIVDLTQDNQLQYSIIHLSDYLTAGREYIISIDFKGLLGDDLAGFYRIKYEDQKGKTTWIAATQFQATDARKAFPCFDEPLYKATFGITIKHWTNMTALSNMPLVSSDVDQTAGWVTDKFAVSHRMSTYLVAFAVTNFESKTLGNITVWARPGMINSADYALDIAGKILKHYEKFFGIDFPLPKMDMIALPDFNAGAMENWGLITYRETAMLYDEKISSVSNKQRVATVVAHELAHQWFGNLVTPKWWDDLWLNEGFASYVEYIGVDHVEPGWKMLDQFVVEENQDVLKADSLSTSHQISIPVNNPDEINEIFDRISYGKGASIIRMMNHFLTEDVLKAGLRNYLAALKYGNAEQSDLWYYLTQVQSEMNISQIVDVKKVMNSWTLQTGFPLVTLMRDYKKNSANLDQNRFQILSKERTATDLTSKWEIPITMTSAKELNWTPRTRLWMHQDDDGPVQVPTTLVPNANQWMLVNVDQVGYYRVNYDVKNWQLLIEQLVVDHTAINPINRAQILDDIFDLAKNNLIDYKFAMNATKYLKKETDFLAWDTILRSFVFIDDMLQRAPIYGEWKEYVSELLEEFYNKYKDQSWTIDGMNDTKSKNDVLAMYNRVNAISWACTVNQHCIKKARALFDEWKNTGVNNIDPSLRGILYCNVIENGDKSDWEFLWKKYEKEQKANERDRLLRSMACSKELWILSRYLEWTFDKTRPIRRQDGSFVFRAIARNNYGRDVAFNFLRERWQTIKDYYGKSSFSFSSLIKSVTSSLNTNFELQQLISFYKSIKNDVGTAKRSFLQSIEEVESNVAWMSNYYKTLEVWIRETRGKPHL